MPFDPFLGPHGLDVVGDRIVAERPGYGGDLFASTNGTAWSPLDLPWEYDGSSTLSLAQGRVIGAEGDRLTAWTRTNEAVQVATSDDGGATWRGARGIGPCPIDPASAAEPSLAVRVGEVDLAAIRCGAESRLITSRDGGSTWTTVDSTRTAWQYGQPVALGDRVVVERFDPSGAPEAVAVVEVTLPDP